MRRKTTNARRPLAAAIVGASFLSILSVALATPRAAEAGSRLTCRKVVSETVTGEGRNAAEGSRVKCAAGEMLTGGTCYAETRPEADGSCQTSAMGIIQPIVDKGGTTEEAFFTCLQTGGTDCPVRERTRAMAICCKIDDKEPAAAAK